VLPSNEERGYVVRKIIRKAVWHGYKLGIRELFLYKLVATVAAVMKEAYPELEDRREYISSILKSEEERFQNTIDSGLMKLSSLMARLKKDKKTVIAGKEVFKLYDTFGFPYELTGKVAQENGFDIDIDGFSSALEEQKERSKSFSQIKEEIFSKDKELLKDIAATDFVGYESVSCESEILAILNEDLDRELSVIKEGKAVIVASKTPFYGKGGGQVADKGEISSKDFLAEVFDVKNIDERVLHFVEIVKGSIKKKSKVSLEVDREKRLAAARNHTATHLLHRALKEVLGDSVEQAGSYVDSKKLRFDFNYFKALSSDELEEVEDRVNNYILANLKLNVKVLAYKEAKEEGALALFSEKYGEKVRVVDIAGVSKELCGGTHVSYTGDIGLFKIISESSSSGGVRRIEAVTAKEARDYYKREEVILDKVSSLLSANQFKAAIEVESLIERLNILEKEANKRELAGIDGQAIDLISKAKKIKSALFVAAELDKDIDIDYISKLSDKIKMRSKNNTVIMLYSLSDNKVKIILSLTKDLIEKGLDARVIFDRISKVIDGGGGGRADFVKAGGKDISKLKEALNLMREYIGDNL
jgi:alanyl-tRNA synthetase